MCGDGKGYADASIPALSSCALTGRCTDGGPAGRPSFHIWHLPIVGEVWLRSLRLPIRLSYLSKLTNRRARFPCYFKFDEQSSNILSADMKHHDYEGPLSRSLKLCRGKAPRKRRLNKQKLRIWKLSEREICQKGAHLIRNSTIKKFREYEASPMRISFIKKP